MTSSLGGWLHYHLGLGIPVSKYSNISGYLFILSVHPGKLTIPENSALHDTICICEEYNEKLKHFHETIAVENVLRSQMNGAIESVYIKELINLST